MTDSCVWKQLIKILLPSNNTTRLILIGLILLTDMCSASSEIFRDDHLDLTANNGDNVEDRSEKVKVKWRGDKFLSANSTLEREKLIETQPNYTTEARSQFSILTTTPMASSALTSSSTSRKRSTLHREKSAQSTTPISTTIKPINKSKGPSLTTSFPKTQQRTTKSAKSSNSKKNKNKAPKTPKPKQAFSKLTSQAPTNLDRTTLIADLSPFQEYYLEYQSDEVEEPTTKKPKRNPFLTITNNKTLNSNQTEGLNSSTFKIQFFPKTPVNLLYILQAYASNMKPIEVQSPIASGIQTSIPVKVSVPVRVNPPKSPFLFHLDLDNFFTRMAISFFYSSIAMAPLIYMIVGGLGKLGGLSMITGKKKKRRRRRRDANYVLNSSRRLKGIDVPKHFQDLGMTQKTGKGLNIFNKGHDDS